MHVTYLIKLARISGTMLNRSDESRYICLFSDHTRKIFITSLLKMVASVGFFANIFDRIEEVSSLFLVCLELLS